MYVSTYTESETSGQGVPSDGRYATGNVGWGRDNLWALLSTIVETSLLSSNNSSFCCRQHATGGMSWSWYSWHATWDMGWFHVVLLICCVATVSPVLIYDTVRQDIGNILNDEDSKVASFPLHCQCVPCTDVTENSGKNDNLSKLIAWPRPVAHVNASSVCHFLNNKTYKTKYL